MEDSGTPGSGMVLRRRTGGGHRFISSATRCLRGLNCCPMTTRIPATLVALDRGHDLAVLQTTTQRGRDSWLPFRKGPAVGEEVFQYGAPLYRSGCFRRAASRRAAPRSSITGSSGIRAEVAHVSRMMQGGTSGVPGSTSGVRWSDCNPGVLSMEGRPVGIAYLVPAEFVRVLLDTRRDAQTPRCQAGGG